MFVIGTAGHVDHGKSALVKALTGIDPDRLREEKERGLTIDLGFAWLRLPSGREVSIVDVPGHERFIKNMLAGVGGIDLALLVIAADEGVMPQTREHLGILDLLRITRGILVITKKDLVDDEWLELVNTEVEEVVKGTTLAGAPVVAVSSVTGDGLSSLVSTLDSLLESMPQKKDVGRPRLPIDRVFTMSGFGTVVTGTLIDGHLSIGQEVEVVPCGFRSRIRGLEMHRRRIETAMPGSRVAINLAGVARGDLGRGDVVTIPGWLKPTTAIDVRLRLMPDCKRPLVHNAPVAFYTGSSEVMGRIRLLEREELEPGETTWAQIKLSQPVAVVRGDYFIIRSPETTIGGGEVIDPYARRHRRFHRATIQRLAAMETESPEEVLLGTLEITEPCELEALASRCSLKLEEAEAIVEALASEERIIILGARNILYSSQGWRRLVERAQLVVKSYHHQFPLRTGIPKEELRSRLKIPSEVVQRLVQDGVLIEEGAVVRLPSHQIQLTEEQQGMVDAFLSSLAKSPYSPPGDISILPELLGVLIEQGKVVKVSQNVVFSAHAYEEMVRQVTEYIKSRGRITVAEVRDLFKTSRKYALALMEHLDEQKITRRVGDERVLR